MTTTHQSTRPDAIPALTGLRFIAALLVLFAHALPKIIPVSNPDATLYVYAHGTALIGMPLFFVLSGFVIQYNYAAQLSTQGATGAYNFFVARFARLYPLFLLCLLYDIENKWSYASLPAQTLDALPYYLTLTHAWLYQAYEKNSLIFIFGWLPQVSWSISAEWFFYLCFPLICWALHKINSARALLIIFFFVAITAIASVLFLSLVKVPINAQAVAHFGPMADAFGPNRSQSFFDWLLIYSPYPRLFDFMLGCIVAKGATALMHRSPSPREEKAALAVMIAAIASIGILLLLLHTPGFAPDGRFKFVTDLRYAAAFSIPIAVFIFCVARYRNGLTRALSAKYMLLGGEISYSIYMLHMLFIAAFRWEAATATSWQIGIADVIRLIIVIAATFGMSLVTYTLIEMPAKKWLTRRLSIRPKAASGPAPLS